MLSSQDIVAKHLQVLTELDQAPLFISEPNETLSSKNNRLKEVIDPHKRW